MTSPVVEIDARALVSRDKFHATFAETFGFFEGYGRNMDAWIDCMGYLRKRHSGMTQFHIGADQTLTIRLNHHEVLRDEGANEWRDLVECSAFLNLREVEAGSSPLIALAF